MNGGGVAKISLWIRRGGGSLQQSEFISTAQQRVALTAFRRESWHCLWNTNERDLCLDEYHCERLSQSAVIIVHLERDCEEAGHCCPLIDAGIQPHSCGCCRSAAYVWLSGGRYVICAHEHCYCITVLSGTSQKHSAHLYWFSMFDSPNLPDIRFTLVVLRFSCRWTKSKFHMKFHKHGFHPFIIVPLGKQLCFESWINVNRFKGSF